MRCRRPRFLREPGKQVSMRAINSGQSAYATASFPKTFFREYSISGNIEPCKILLKVSDLFRAALCPHCWSRHGLFVCSCACANCCVSALGPPLHCPGSDLFSHIPLLPRKSCLLCSAARRPAAQPMCAVFKFASNVEEFVIAMDCDKSELSIVLTCKDGEPFRRQNMHARFFFFALVSVCVAAHKLVSVCVPAACLISKLGRVHLAGQCLCSRCFFQYPLQ